MMPFVPRFLKPTLFYRALRRRLVSLQLRLSPGRMRKLALEKLVGPVGVWDELQSYQLRFLQDHGLQPQHTLLDIGCGPLQGGIAFLRYLEPNRYTGIDVRCEPLLWAYRLVSENELVDRNPHLILTQTFGTEELEGRVFDYIWMSQMLYHISGVQLVQLLAALARFSHSGTRIYGDILCPTRPGLQVDSRWRGFEYYAHNESDIRRLAAAHGFTVQTVGRLRDNGYPAQLTRASNYMLAFAREAG